MSTAPKTERDVSYLSFKDLSKNKVTGEIINGTFEGTSSKIRRNGETGESFNAISHRFGLADGSLVLINNAAAFEKRLADMELKVGEKVSVIYGGKVEKETKRGTIMAHDVKINRL
jgi:hypothetical protein